MGFMMGSSRGAKYLAFLGLAPACGFVSMGVIAPITSGAHDGGFLGMAFGLLVGNVIFAHVLLDRWRIVSALAVWLTGAVITWTTLMLLAGWADPAWADSLTLWGVLFFVIYFGVSVLAWEGAYRWTSVRRWR